MGRTIIFIFIAALISLPTALADSLDPATLHIGAGAGTSCATGCGGDPNLIGSGSTIDIYQNANGAPSVSQPTLLILGVPNDSTNLFTASPTSVSFYNPYPGSSTSGSSAFAIGGSTQWGMKTPATAGTGFFGDFTSSSMCGTNTCRDVYNYLNLLGDRSNSFGNWASADLSKDGITATEFGIYVFALSGAQLGPNGLINISGFSTALPTGTFAVGWGCWDPGTESCEPKYTYTTPFTQSGLTNVSEPGTFVLLGAGLLSLIGLMARRRARV